MAKYVTKLNLLCDNQL